MQGLDAHVHAIYSGLDICTETWEASISLACCAALSSWSVRTFSRSTCANSLSLPPCLLRRSRSYSCSRSVSHARSLSVCLSPCLSFSHTHTLFLGVSLCLYLYLYPCLCLCQYNNLQRGVAFSNVLLQCKVLLLCRYLQRPHLCAHPV